MIRRKRSRQLWSPTVAASGWTESTFAEQAWEQSRGAAVRWAIAGALFGIVAGLVLFAPAAWLAQAVASATHQRLVLADARGTIWSGSAVPVLTGGADSRDASLLPGRLEWTLSPRLYGAQLALRQECCLNGSVLLQIRPGLGRTRTTLVPPGGWVGQWPSAWLGGLGTPWNTMQLGGTVRVVSPGFSVEIGRGPLAPRRLGERGTGERIVAPDDTRHARHLPGDAERRRGQRAARRCSRSRRRTVRCSSRAAAPGGRAASSSAARHDRQRSTKRPCRTC